MRNETIIDLLLDHGADVNAAGGKRCGTPLQTAAGAGLEEVVKTLVGKGAKINDPKSGEYGYVFSNYLSKLWHLASHLLPPCVLRNIRIQNLPN